MLYWILKRVLLGPIVLLLFRPRVQGAEHVPATGPAILASNHLSVSDSIFLPAVLSRRITFPAKMEYFTGRGIVGWLKRAFFKGTGQIPIDRSGGSASTAALDAGLEVLSHGGLFGIYPEGTRSPDGRLYKGKTGVVRMALKAGCPVIPVAMIGTDRAQPTGQKIPTITCVGVRFGQPIHFTQFAGLEHDGRALRAMTDEVMYALMRLSGQEYVDEYAAGRKLALAARAQEAAARAQGAAAKAQEAWLAARDKMSAGQRADDIERVRWSVDSPGDERHEARRDSASEVL